MLDDLTQGDIQTERALLVGVFGPDTAKVEAEEHLEELALLTLTAGAK